MSTIEEKEYKCPLSAHEQRFVFVDDIPDFQGIPCFPAPFSLEVSGPYISSKNTTMIPNSSWITFIEWKEMPDNTVLWTVALDSGERVMIPATSLPYLRKMHRPNPYKLRRLRRGHR